MDGLNFYSQFNGELGIPIHARELAYAISKELKDLNLIQLPLNNINTSQYPEIKPFFKRPNQNFSSLIFWYPNIYEDYNVYKKNMGLFVFEYTKIPKNFIDSINKLDIIFTPSQWGVNLLKENGVKTQCEIMRGGVNYEKFHPSDTPRVFNGVYKFLHIGKIENRKGTELLIRAFAKAFNGDKKVSLTMMIDNPHVKNFSPEQYIKNIGYSINISLDNIIIKHAIQNPLTNIYQEHDCAVFPQSAEAIGLPIVESMASGLAVIVTLNSGISEYADDSRNILLKKTVKTPVYDINFFPNKGEFGEWDSPTEEELIEALRWVYNNQKEAKERGIMASKWMRENYSWDLAAKKFINQCL